LQGAEEVDKSKRRRGRRKEPKTKKEKKRVEEEAGEEEQKNRSCETIAHPTLQLYFDIKVSALC
jgi:hypothetical protein